MALMQRDISRAVCKRVAIGRCTGNAGRSFQSRLGEVGFDVPPPTSPSAMPVCVFRLDLKCVRSRKMTEGIASTTPKMAMISPAVSCIVDRG